ncbi:hypothetical protein SPRG_18866 [Saprolegnia parasitica CBS 223.65]|uniref:Uncharacterized protein n=1 Tax=Saprolegnia parasitica (strain CBS 223.65) TaxID=695850 RepID=A0A067CZ28_SAPPC|nr:hypothetical protein SPRG_18866 [Saprolegnia parasitica CBS 223.65]KDO35718.1 hypothetical protein SPRG_18866 [Saprolegnia parasitica CBS 223.65]|eukprot:XP_012194082.1 hypothetical protein SPRG_18866 [Saprolegnia parasitica CBS 223.65]
MIGGWWRCIRVDSRDVIAPSPRGLTPSQLSLFVDVFGAALDIDDDDAYDVIAFSVRAVADDMAALLPASFWPAMHRQDEGLPAEMRRQLKLRLASCVSTKLPFLDTTAERVLIEALALAWTDAAAPARSIDGVLSSGGATTHALSVLIRAALGLLDERELLQRVEFSLMVRVVNFSIPIPFSAGLAPTLVEDLLAVTETAIDETLETYLRETPPASAFIGLLEENLVNHILAHSAHRPVPASNDSFPMRIERALLSAVVATYFQHGADPRKVESILALYVAHSAARYRRRASSTSQLVA